MSRTILRYADHGTPRWGVQFGHLIAPLDVDAASTGELLSGHWELLWATPPESATVPLEKTLDTSFITTSARRCSGGGGVMGSSESDIDCLGI